jgi:hypothetical protein
MEKLMEKREGRGWERVTALHCLYQVIRQEF